MAAQSQNTPDKKRDKIGMILLCLYNVVLIFALVLIGRIIYIQVGWKPNATEEKYFKTQSTKKTIYPDRGSILGYDGTLLAISTPMYQLYMDCTVSKEDDKWLQKARNFADTLAIETGGTGESYYKMIAVGRKRNNKYLKLGSPIDHEAYLRIAKTELMNGVDSYKSGVIQKTIDTRKYPYGELAKRTIGYVKDNSNSNGNSHIGIEGKFDYVLHGKEGLLYLRKTDNNGKIQEADSSSVKPVNGEDVRTTLDITLQDIVDKALRNQIQDNHAIQMGCAVVMEVSTGAIRAMVNLNRDSTDWSLNESYNMAIGLSSEPGSVFKATTLMTCLEDGKISSLDETIPTNNGHLPGYPDDDHLRGTTEISILHGFEISSNYVFRYLAVKNYEGKEKDFMDKLYMYKLGQKFDFDLDGLKDPFLPTPGTANWYRNTLGSVGMGYAIQETPLHILTFYNAIANKGKMMKPYLVEDIEHDGIVTKKLGPSVLNASICSRATADTLLRALKAVTSDGTAERLAGAKLQVAGKTGTSWQVLTPEEVEKYGKQTEYKTSDGSLHDLATFVGFFPADAPKYSVIICLKTYLIHGMVAGGGIPAATLREIVDKIYALDSDWGGTIDQKVAVPVMACSKKPSAKKGIVPDVSGLGLKDALYVIEASGLRCRYSGSGHVCSQNPAAGQTAKTGTAVTITLK